MKNHSFEIQFDADTGAIKSIQNIHDKDMMNWVRKDARWGIIHSKNDYLTFDNGVEYHEYYPVLTYFSDTNDRAVSEYSNEMVKITVERFFTEKDNFCERYTVKNLRNSDIFIGQDNFGIVTPFNDCYSSADECMVRRCNTHVWCGKNTSYVNALRMGESEINLGLILTRGKLSSYSIEDCESNTRGIFVLNSDFFTLTPGAEYIIEWELFWHTGNEDFYKKALMYPQTILIEAVNHTVYKDEIIEFTTESLMCLENAIVTCNGEKIDYILHENKMNVKYEPSEMGEHVFEIIVDDITTYAEFLVVEPLEKIVEKRIEFIIDKQQYHNEKSSLHGSYLIYDRREKHLVFNDAYVDHNACRERIGMALLVAKYLQLHSNDKFKKSLDSYIEFLKREFYDEETGEVYNSIHKPKENYRLYNAPWVMMLFAEMYFVTNDTYYTDQIVKIVRKYYDKGGAKFYPNAVSFVNIIKALTKSKNKDLDEVLNLFKHHTENIISIGTSYPPHEVKYEQTIVTPAVTLICDMGKLTGDARYTEEAKKHIANLERFNGHQPSFHLNEIPIRYWDDFWFGKSALLGDTFPHYWSCLTASAYMGYYKISGEERYKIAARKCIRNCLCLFMDDGFGSAAYVYPYMSNGKKGQFYDDWANDQDFALYFALGDDFE